MQLTHHAYLYEGEPALLPSLMDKARSLMGLSADSPDAVALPYEKFGINEARALQDLATLKSVSGHALFVVAVSSMTTEAQQALLKLFEEPQKGVVFVLLAPPGMLLPTLRSRCLPFPETITSAASHSRAKEFLSASYKERSTQVTALVKESADNRAAARAFMDDLERELYGKLGAGKNEIAHALQEIQTLRTYLSDRSPSLKMIFEHLAASIPKV